MQLAAELRRVRETLGLTQEQMAERVGLGYAPAGRKVSTGRATVSQWERGRRTPSPEQLKAYADLGGDPVLLAPQPAVPLGELAEVPAAGPASAFDRPTVSARAAPRWPWLVFGLAAAAAAVAAGCFAALSALSGPGGPAPTWTETTGTPAHAWADPVQLTGAGTPLGPRQSVQVLCRVKGYVVQDGDPWWYRLASAPWNGRYYATSDAFYNNGATSGSVDTGVVVDEQIPVCPGS
jgi:transcriptional regulator with XRE-family HTH domain